jgi:hypothetical protein
VKPIALTKACTAADACAAVKEVSSSSVLLISRSQCPQSRYHVGEGRKRYALIVGKPFTSSADGHAALMMPAPSLYTPNSTHRSYRFPSGSPTITGHCPRLPKDSSA